MVSGWKIRTGGVKAESCLSQLSQHAPDAGHGTKNEDNIHPELQPPMHLHFPENNERHCEQAKVHDNVDDAEDGASVAISETLDRFVGLAGGYQVKSGSRWLALEYIHENCTEGVDHEDGEEGPIGDLPFAGCEGGEAHVEHNDRHLDDPDREEKVHSGEAGELIAID